MNEQWFSEDDQLRRLELREGLFDIRRRATCRRCKKKIPESRRRDSLYCSGRCHSLWRWESLLALRAEVRAEYRRLAAGVCSCGEVVSSEPGRPGPRRRWCSKRCRDREAQRRCQERKKARDAEGDCKPPP